MKHRIPSPGENTRIPFSTPCYFGDEVEFVKRAVESTWISDGKYINDFETELEKRLNVRYARVTSNGTSALMLAFLALGIKPGDEIIVPGFCFQAAANTAKILGAVPVFADVDPKTWNIDKGEIIRKTTPKTKAIVVVHNYGNPDDVTSLTTLLNIPVIEDCAEAIFSRVGTKFCGTMGTIGTLSFHATKTITSGEGGAVITEKSEPMPSIDLYRSHGLNTRGTYNHVLPGSNFRMTNMQAALGYAQILNSHEIIVNKIRILQEYKEQFLEDFDALTLQEMPDNGVVLWSIAVKINPDKFNFSRDEIIRKLKHEFGIEARPGFVSASKLSIYNAKNLPVSSELSDTVIVLPSFTALSLGEIIYITQALRKMRK